MMPRHTAHRENFVWFQGFLAGLAVGIGIFTLGLVLVLSNAL